MPQPERSRPTPRLAAALLAGSGLVALLLAPDPAFAEAARRGAAEFQQYCATCHGADARGNGPTADSLKKEPPDLTTLHERYGRPLPRARLAEFIDGRRPVAGHGSREMPVWGKKLYSDVPRVMPEPDRRAVIQLLLDYLESVQEKS